MKKLLFMMSMILGTAAFVNAQNQDTTQTQTQSQNLSNQDQDRQKIEISQLPQAIRTELESTDYAGWNISSAYRSTQTETSDETKSMEVYVVELKNGADTQTLEFDRDGNRLNDDNQNRE